MMYGYFTKIFLDIAVGAPGGDKGSVYIFNGHADGINEKYSQVCILCLFTEVVQNKI